jgi:hypothetical protein
LKLLEVQFAVRVGGSSITRRSQRIVARDVRHALTRFDNEVDITAGAEVTIESVVLISDMTGVLL